MTIISKAAAGLSVGSCIYDMHKSGVVSANRNYAKASADTFISNELNAMRTDDLSYKNSQIKNWCARNNPFQSVNETLGRVTGYLNGFFAAGVKYIPNLIAGSVAMFSKHKGLANIAAGALAVMEGWNFIKNTTGVKQRNDYLKL